MTNTNTDVVYQELQNLIESFPSGLTVPCLRHLEIVYIMEFKRSLDYKALGASTLEDLLHKMGNKYVLWLKEGESEEKYVISSRIIAMRQMYLKNDIQELLISHGGEIEFNSFEDSYMDHFNEKLAYDYYGLTRGLEELCEILEDIRVEEVANPSRKVIKSVNRYNLRKRKRRMKRYKTISDRGLPDI